MIIGEFEPVTLDVFIGAPSMSHAAGAFFLGMFLQRMQRRCCIDCACRDPRRDYFSQGPRLLFMLCAVMSKHTRF